MSQTTEMSAELTKLRDQSAAYRAVIGHLCATVNYVTAASGLLEPAKAHAMNLARASIENAVKTADVAKGLTP